MTAHRGPYDDGEYYPTYWDDMADLRRIEDDETMFQDCPYGFCDLPESPDHYFCEYMRKRLDSVSEPTRKKIDDPNWFQHFQERWEMWKIMHPRAMLTDTATNDLLRVTGWRVR